jgi:hypothetical protein
LFKLAQATEDFDWPPAMSFPAPDYELMESLVQKLLDQLRAANIMIATGQDDVAILAVLRAGEAAHERLAALRKLTIEMQDTSAGIGARVADSDA